MFKRLILSMRKSVWLYPLFYSIISIVIASAVRAADTRYLFDLERVLPEILFTRIGLAQTVLGVIAGSLLTMTTFTFSTTMIVLSMYTSQYSPRTVENFLNDDVTMKVLGIFMGGFVYSILSLLFMQDSLSDYNVIAASVGVIYSIVCLAYFSIFINKVGNLIQANNLIYRLYSEAKENIAGYKESLEYAGVEDSIDYGDRSYEVILKSKKNGYIQLVDKEAIMALAEEFSAMVVIDLVIGQFITDETAMMKLYFEEPTELDEDMEKNLTSAIVIGIERNEQQDFDFSVQKIVEIALRAISPGINDPNTANHCIKILGVLMGMIADLEDGHIVVKGKDGRVVLVSEAISFEKELYFTFYQIINYGREDISVVISIYKALKLVWQKATPDNKMKIQEFGDYIYGKVETDLKTGMDGNMIDVERAELA